MTHPAWRRSHVRELCLHLVLVEDAGRDVIVRRLWPDLEPRAGARNLRVTLSHLADVLDPDRRKGTGSDLVEDRWAPYGCGLMSGSTSNSRCRPRAACSTPAQPMIAGRAPTLGLARRLLRFSGGAVLGGAATTDGWADPYLDLRRNLLVQAPQPREVLLAAHGHAEHRGAAGSARARRGPVG